MVLVGLLLAGRPVGAEPPNFSPADLNTPGGANVPLVLPGFDSINAAANSTLITGGTEPTMSDIDSIALGNYSGSTANYTLAVID